MPRGKWERPPSLKKTNRAEYSAWLNALHRCHNAAHYSYPEYGSRGISVCDEWRNAATGFQTFFKDMGKRPSPLHSIERKDNNAGYFKENCVWADRKTQQNNLRKKTTRQLDFGLGFKRNSPLIEFQGTTKSLREWADSLAMKNTTLRQRLKRGMTVEQAFTAKTEDLKCRRKRNVLAQITIH